MTPSNGTVVRLFEQVRSDFDRLRFECGPVEVQLVHRATNAEAEGVEGFPFRQQGTVSFGGAGNREARQRFDEKGLPLFRDDPVVDVDGRPILNPAGDAYDLVMPASRSVEFSGNIPDYQKLSALAERAGRLMSTCKNLPAISMLAGWRFSNPRDLWWAFLFELAWAGSHPLLTAERRIWLPAETPNTFLPYDIESLRLFARAGVGFKGIPEQWLKRLPDAYVSELANVSSASFDAVDYLLGTLMPPTDKPKDARTSHAKTQMSAPSSAGLIRRRFAVALSFPGEHRPLVKATAESLASAFGQDRIFYDHYYEAELAVANLDLRLQQFYKDESDLVVVFVCGKYAEKDWCGLEWRAIRDLMKDRSRPDQDVMFLRLDKEPLEGMLSIDGYLDISTKTPRVIADLIFRRWSTTR